MRGMTKEEERRQREKGQRAERIMGPLDSVKIEPWDDRPVVAARIREAIQGPIETQTRGTDPEKLEPLLVRVEKTRKRLLEGG